MNHWNQLLPSVVRDDLQHDEHHSFQQIEKSVVEINATLKEKTILVTNKAVGKFARQLFSHLHMKYTLTVAFLDATMNTLMDLYLSGHLSVTMKIRALECMKALCKAAHSKFMDPSADNAQSSAPQMAFRFSYLPLWKEIMSIVSREGRGMATCSEHVLSELLTALVDFLHGARQFIRTDVPEESEDSISLLVSGAMEKLKDVRFSGCTEGVLMLINCLPTDYAHYDRMVPQWVECWIGGSTTSAGGTSAALSGMDHNAHWDYAWLTLLARARKHYKPSASAGFTWQSLLPVLITKATQLMTIPTTAGIEGAGSVQHSAFPHAFHPHYARILLVQSANQQNSADARDMALRKLAKLLYFITSAVTYDISEQPILVPALPLGISPPEGAVAAIAAAQVPVGTDALRVLPGAVDFMQLMSALRVFFYPSNVGGWTPLLSNFFIMYAVQLCRHVGHTLATALQGAAPLSRHYQHPLHLPTVQYLVTNLLPFCLEGLYSKNPYMSQCCAQVIKNLLTVEPAVCAPIVVPFLLAALDPAAVSNAHQAPIAMQTLTNCFKALMYPQPVLLPYLQDILKLSLPGIEPSDVMKTSITLNMYCTVLAWMPTTLRGADAVLPAYMDVLQDSKSASVLGHVAPSPTQSQAAIDSQLQVLTEYISGEWASALLTRIFALLEAQEVLVEGAKPSPLAGSIGQLGSYLFQALRELPGLDAEHPLQQNQTQLRLALQGQVRKYFATTTPLNGVKGCAKVVEAMVTADPSILSGVLTELLCPASTSVVPAADVASRLLGAFSADKVAFRLRLAGGACRAATSDCIAPCLPLLTPIVTSAAFYNHEEKAVRTATSKILKDVLKGAASLYPTALQPTYASNATQPLCFPTTNSADNAKWHVPSAASLPSIVALLRAVISAPMEDMRRSLLDAAASSSPAPSAVNPAGASSESTVPAATPATTFKKSEELFVSRLTLIEKALRGAAEVLGDLTNEPEDLASPAEPVHWKLLSTGRDNLIAALPDAADRLFLQSLRVEVLRFLMFFQDSLFTLFPIAHPFASLKNNITIQTLWVDLFNLVVTRRMACLKDVENVRKYLRYSIKSGRSSITNVVYHRMKAAARRSGAVEASVGARSFAAGQDWVQQLQTVDYWKNHDSSTSGVACMAWAQYVLRCKVLSLESIRRCHAPSFVRCLELLLQRLCDHEYDQIRKVALRQFDAISAYFGSKMLATVQKVVQSLQSGPHSYWEVSGALSVLAQAKVQKRIMGEASLLQQFLQAMLLQSQALILSATEEADKREKLTLKVVDVLLRYVKRWCTTPALAGADDNAYMLNLALTAAGCTDTDSFSPLSSAIATGGAAEAKSALGLRFETFAGFIVLHIIGRPAGLDLQRPGSPDLSAESVTSATLWQWVLTTLSNAQIHSQPPQTIALAALSRLSYLLSQLLTGPAAAHPAVQQCVDLARRLLSPTSPTSSLRAIVTSAALTHPRNAEDGTAQWGSGIEQVLQASQFLKTVVPRRYNGLRSDQGAYSRTFRKEDAAVYMSLAQAGLLCSGDVSAGMFSAANLTALFLCTADLPSSSEGETRLNNLLRAEVFAGVLRAYRVDALKNGSLGSSSAQAAEAVFLQCLKDCTEKASVDYARDWCEAVYFAYLDVPCRLTVQGRDVRDTIAAYVVDRLVQVVLVPTAQGNLAAAADTAAAEAASGDAQQAAESFANQSKILSLAGALLRADQEASCAAAAVLDSPSTASVWGGELLQLLMTHAENGLVSPYRSTRNDMAFLLHTLTENAALENSPEFVAICARIASACEASAVPAMEDTVAGTEGIAPASSAGQVAGFKNAADTVCLLLRSASHNLTAWRFHSVWRPLFAAALISAGSMTSSAVETAKMCHDTCLLVCNSAIRVAVSSTSPSGSAAAVTDRDNVSELLSHLTTVAQDKALPLHSRETLMKCVALLMGNNWYTLSADERKVCRDLFAQGLDDAKPEVQQLAQVGMVAYLAAYKTVPELASIAAVYVKNSDILAAREKKAKKLSEGINGGTAKVDIKHQNTVYMMSCLILATPYDLSANYVPALLTSFVRHASVPALKDTVTRTVQLFKRTHQDRWEEFKKAFTADQLDELQGTGAAHYYS